MQSNNLNPGVRDRDGANQCRRLFKVRYQVQQYNFGPQLPQPDFEGPQLRVSFQLGQDQECALRRGGPQKLPRQFAIRRDHERLELPPIALAWVRHLDSGHFPPPDFGGPSAPGAVPPG